MQRRLNRQARPIHIFFSHFHWDHVQGLPYFSPLYQQTSEISFYSHAPVERMNTILRAQMAPPMFPVPFDRLACTRKLVRVRNRPLDIGGAQISSFPLSHPQGAYGYRIEHQGRSVVYASDHEHGDAACDAGLHRAAANADVLIYDAHLTPSEYRVFSGWGHSTWLAGARLAREAGVKQLLLFHHSPERSDAAVESIAAQARRVFPGTIAAVEGLSIRL